MISTNPSWEMVGLYADEESGTRALKRENFMRMIADSTGGAGTVPFTVSGIALIALAVLLLLRRRAA